MSAREQHKLHEVPTACTAEAPHRRTKAEELAALLEAHRGQRHVVVIQSFPDPDAISSALAHQLIASRYGIECDIAYNGLISHHENIALVELLDISMVRMDDGSVAKNILDTISCSGEHDITSISGLYRNFLQHYRRNGCVAGITMRRKWAL